MGGRSLKAGRSRRVAGRSRRVCAKCVCIARAYNMVRLWGKRGGPWAREDLYLLMPVAWVAKSPMGTGIAGPWRTGGVCCFACARSCPAMGMSEKRRSRSGARENERGCVGGSEHGASGGAALVWRGALCRARCAATAAIWALTMGATPSMQRILAKRSRRPSSGRSRRRQCRRSAHGPPRRARRPRAVAGRPQAPVLAARPPWRPLRPPRGARRTHSAGDCAQTDPFFALLAGRASSARTRARRTKPKRRTCRSASSATCSSARFPIMARRMAPPRPAATSPSGPS